MTLPLHEPEVPTLGTPYGQGRASARTLPATQHDDTSDPPTVRVTIGRVEVRAMIEPAPAAEEPAPATPALSLEDYLRQRSGGPA